MWLDELTRRLYNDVHSKKHRTFQTRLDGKTWVGATNGWAMLLTKTLPNLELEGVDYIKQDKFGEAITMESESVQTYYWKDLKVWAAKDTQIGNFCGRWVDRELLNQYLVPQIEREVVDVYSRSLIDEAAMMVLRPFTDEWRIYLMCCSDGEYHTEPAFPAHNQLPIRSLDKRIEETHLRKVISIPTKDNRGWETDATDP